MFQVPVTFLFDFPPQLMAPVRRFIMHEFAANGAKHLVLSDTMIGKIMEDYHFAEVLRKEMQEAGLTFVDAHAPFGSDIDLNVKDPAKRKILLSRHTTSMMIAADMGVNTITIHVGNTGPEKAYPVPEHIDCIKRSLDVLLPVAEKIGITICIENIWMPTNQPEALLNIKEVFPTDALGFCYDAGHANLMAKGRNSGNDYVTSRWLPYGYTADRIQWDNQILEKMLPHVVNCHLHDNDGTDDQHRNIGHGNIDWPHIAGLLKKAPRLKCIQSEVIPIREMEPVSSICKAFERLDKLSD